MASTAKKPNKISRFLRKVRGKPKNGTTTQPSTSAFSEGIIQGAGATVSQESRPHNPVVGNVARFLTGGRQSSRSETHPPPYHDMGGLVIGQPPPAYGEVLRLRNREEEEAAHTRWGVRNVSNHNRRQGQSVRNPTGVPAEDQRRVRHREVYRGTGSAALGDMDSQVFANAYGDGPVRARWEPPPPLEDESDAGEVSADIPGRPSEDTNGQAPINAGQNIPSEARAEAVLGSGSVSPVDLHVVAAADVQREAAVNNPTESPEDTCSVLPTPSLGQADIDGPREVVVDSRRTSSSDDDSSPRPGFGAVATASIAQQSLISPTSCQDGGQRQAIQNPGTSTTAPGLSGVEEPPMQTPDEKEVQKQGGSRTENATKSQQYDVIDDTPTTQVKAKGKAVAKSKVKDMDAKETPKSTSKNKGNDDQPPPSEGITHVGSDGSTSYYEKPKPIRRTTPGYEWASSSNGYDWESRKAHYGSDNPTMGQAYQRELQQREAVREQNLAKVKAEREEAAKIGTNERIFGMRA